MIQKIVSGGQSGVDRAALDVAIALGRKAEDGVIAAQYALQETPSEDYAVRTLWNTRDSDGTLILAWGPLEGGTALTLTCTQDLNKPCLVIDLLKPKPASEAQGLIYVNAYTFISQLLSMSTQR